MCLSSEWRLIFYVLIISALLNVHATESKTFLPFEDEWTVTFYTGVKIWSGTDSVINVQIYGTAGKSEIIQIIPDRPNMESRSVDKFSLGALNELEFGTIGSITVTKQHSYAFFNDWELLKVEVKDPRGKTYLFECKCWLTTLKYKRNIELYSIDGVKIEHNLNVPNVAKNQKNLQIFPVTVTLLFLFLMLVMFTYFGNMVFQKWKEHSAYFSDGASRRGTRTRGVDTYDASGVIQRSTVLNAGSHLDENLYKTDDEEDSVGNTSSNHNRNRIYNFTNTNDLNSMNMNRNLSRSQYASNVLSVPGRIVANLTDNDDNPPEYKELFPMKDVVSQSDNNNVEPVDSSRENSTKLTTV